MFRFENPDGKCTSDRANVGQDSGWNSDSNFETGHDRIKYGGQKPDCEPVRFGQISESGICPKCLVGESLSIFFE